ncbi:threonine--tRNA ligase [Caldinitratiruptor microaerophilus]|uniref:Threonine--tRNA ligase n=1 Tax=Caldinitratiruptor microaerophilus TaxID=671077 RepID=A0AA35CKE2_9FIRM|nr:threonine--tRNA ligase [Caldinitratiruptor microaerophilus]BDG60842.1 threonine--tRNA ligase [Caldinitratiruptor microaerophilus]
MAQPEKQQGPEVGAGEIRVRLPDGSERLFPRGTTAAEVARSLGPRLARAALAAEIDGEVRDLSTPLQEDCSLRILTFADEEGRRVFRHSSAHLMAQAVKRLWPDAKLTVGPPLEDGFYYDIDMPQPISSDDFPRIEAEMARIVQEDLPIVREEVDREWAKRFFAERGEDYKVLLVDRIPEGEPVSIYRQGEFADLCVGPHVPSTGRLKAFKLLSVAGAYWEGDQRNKQLQRLYGTSFEKPADLDLYLRRLEEAKRRDHRRLGAELDLYAFKDEAPGFAFWLPKGYLLYRTLENWSREVQERRGYQEVRTPWIFHSRLYETSGHWQHYRQNMFLIRSEDEWFATKPMNCPGHCLLYKAEVRSYRDLPIKIAEYGPLSRYEVSGALHGLVRVRGFHQDDAHLFVREDQIEEQIREVLGIIEEIYGTLGLEYEVKLSTRPEDFMGEIETWNRAEAALAAALEKSGRPYKLNPGDGAFYGPKLDFDVTDALGRKWQCATIQLDFQLPEKFDLTYVDRDGREKRPVMIHRAVMGSIERFIGILTEHFAGTFPAWLAPEQVRVLPVAERHHEYAFRVAEELRARGLRADADLRNEKVGYKIREAEVKKVPFILVVGDREVDGGTVSVRRRGMQDLGAMLVGEFADLARREVAGKVLDDAARKATQLAQG